MGVICGLLVPAWCQGTVVATANWRSSVQALVNVGRKPLAEALGLEIPQDLALEREMWRTIGWLVKYRYNDQIVPLLQAYRRAPSHDGKATGAAVDSAGRTARAAESQDHEGVGTSGTAETGKDS